MIDMIKEMGRNKINMVTMNPRIYCDGYEENIGALVIAKEHETFQHKPTPPPKICKQQ